MVHVPLLLWTGDMLSSIAHVHYLSDCTFQFHGPHAHPQIAVESSHWDLVIPFAVLRYLICALTRSSALPRNQRSLPYNIASYQPYSEISTVCPLFVYILTENVTILILTFLLRVLSVLFSSEWMPAILTSRRS
jgi:hypothetical protein